MNRLAGVVVALLAVAGSVVPAVAAPSTRATQLGGTTVIHASSSSFLKVRLDRRSVVSGLHDWQSPIPNPDITLSGRGRVIGLVLTQMQDRPSATVRATLVATRYNMCSGRACRATRPPIDLLQAGGEGVEQYEIDGEPRILLPAGVYGLYVIADGAPVTVKLRLPGAAGTRVLTARSPAATHVLEALPDSAIAAPVGRRHAGEGRLPLPVQGMVTAGHFTRSKELGYPQGGFAFSANRSPDRLDPVTACKLGRTADCSSASASQFRVADDTRPAGNQITFVNVLPGHYRFAQEWFTNSTEYDHAFLGIALAYRSLR